MTVTGSQPALLTGIVFDAEGGRLTPTHASKGAKRYRYYVSTRLVTGAPDKRTAADALRLPAGGLDALVAQAVRDLIANPNALLDALGPAVAGAAQQHALLAAAETLAREWRHLDGFRVHEVIRATVTRVTVHPEEIRVDVVPQQLRALLLGGAGQAQPAEQAEAGPACHTITVPALLKRADLEMRLVVQGNTSAAKADQTLARLVCQAMAYSEQLMAPNGLSIAELAANAAVSECYYTRVLRLGFLAPDILTAIANGRQPVGLTGTKLLSDTRLKLLWHEQGKALGF